MAHSTRQFNDMMLHLNSKDWTDYPDLEVLRRLDKEISYQHIRDALRIGRGDANIAYAVILGYLEGTPKRS